MKRGGGKEQGVRPSGRSRSPASGAPTRSGVLGWSAIWLVVGLLLRLWFLRSPNPIEGDPLLYSNIARNLLQHGVYSFSAAGGPVVPTLIRLPGYPLFLAGCFAVFGVGNFVAMRLVQVLVDLVTCVVVARTARDLFGRRAGLACLGMSALCPFTANYVASPLTETSTLATIAWAFFCLNRWRMRAEWWNGWMWGMGVAVSASVLLRPEQGLLAAVVVGAVVWWSFLRGRDVAGWRRVMPALVVALCVVLPLAPWTARNWRVFHVVQPLAPRSATDPGERVPAGFDQWFRSWAIDFRSSEEVYWNYDGSPIAMSDLPARAFDSAAERAETAALLAKYDENNTPTAALDAGFARLAAERRRASRLRYYVWLPMARLGNMLLRPRTELMQTQLDWWNWRNAPGQTVFAAAYAGLNLLYLVLGVWGWVRWRRVAQGSEWVVLWGMTAFVVLRCGLLLTLDNSEPRYTLELFPVLVVWAGAVWWGRESCKEESGIVQR